MWIKTQVLQICWNICMPQYAVILFHFMWYTASVKAEHFFNTYSRVISIGARIANVYAGNILQIQIQIQILFNINPKPPSREHIQAECVKMHPDFLFGTHISSQFCTASQTCVHGNLHTWIQKWRNHNVSKLLLMLAAEFLSCRYCCFTRCKKSKCDVLANPLKCILGSKLSMVTASVSFTHHNHYFSWFRILIPFSIFISNSIFLVFVCILSFIVMCWWM